jgi:hypothetical protein
MQHNTSESVSSLFKMTFNLKVSVYQEFILLSNLKKKHFSSEILITLTFSDSGQSHDWEKMQHETSDILFSAFKNTFVMNRFICFTDIFIYKQLSCHAFIKKSIFVLNIDKINNLKLCLIRQLK